MADSPPPLSLLRGRDLSILAPAYAIPGIASFVTVPILFAILGPAEYGRWALIYGIAAGVPQVTTSWLEATVLRFGHRRGQPAPAGRVVTALAGSIVFSGVSTMALVPGATILELASAAALTTVISLYVLAIASLQSAMSFGAISITASIRSIIGAVLAVTGAVVSGRAAIAIVGLAAGYAVGQILGRVVPRPTVAAAGPLEPPIVEVGPPETLSYGVASAFAAVASYALSVGDRFILSAFRPLAEVGAYAATYTLVDLAGRFIPSLALTTMRPRVFRAWDRGARATIGTAVVRLAVVLLWAVALTVLGLIVGSFVFRQLPVAYDIVGPIAIGFGCFMAASTLGLTYSAATRQSRLAVHLVAAAGLNVMLNLLLAPSLGAVGAAIATGASYGALLGFNILGLNLPVRLDRATIAVGLAAAASVLILSVGAGRFPPAWSVVAASVPMLAVAPLVIRAARRLPYLD